MCSSDLAQPGKVETDDGHGSITCLAAHHACRCTRAIHTSSEPRGRGSCKCLAKNGAAGRSACVRDATTTQHRQQHTRCRCMVTMPIEAAGRTAYAWLLLPFVGAASAERRSGAVPSRGCGSISSGSGGTRRRRGRGFLSRLFRLKLPVRSSPEKHETTRRFAGGAAPARTTARGYRSMARPNRNCTTP
jgi:hypothetical protein